MVTFVWKESCPLPTWHWANGVRGLQSGTCIGCKGLDESGFPGVIFGSLYCLASDCASAWLFVLCLSWALSTLQPLFFFFLLSSSVIFPLKNLLLLCDLIYGPAVEHDLLDIVFWKWLCRMTMTAVFLCFWCSAYRCLENLWSQWTAVFRG